MKISAFTIIRNAEIYDFPIVKCITSALDLVDEFIVVAGDSADDTNEILKSIRFPKVKIIHTIWNKTKYPRGGSIYAHQTDLALKACTGNWCLYLQSDEVLHEDAVPVIRKACEKYFGNPKVEGFVFKYVHIIGDYRHYIDAMHFGYPREIRMVRGNVPAIHSWRDAQSFRYIEEFDYRDYWQKENTRKLNCILLDAYIFHYGWSRDPRKINAKIREQKSMHDDWVNEEKYVDIFDYGNLDLMPVFKGSQPAVMRERIERMDWQDYLRYTGPVFDNRKINSRKYRIINFLENKILAGRRIGGFRNYKMIGKFKG